MAPECAPLCLHSTVLSSPLTDACLEMFAVFKQGARRVSDPVAPSWASAALAGDTSNPLATEGVSAGTASVWGSVCTRRGTFSVACAFCRPSLTTKVSRQPDNFMRGDGYQCAGSVTQADVHEAANALLDGGRAETVRMGAAYQLGNACRHAEVCATALEALSAALAHPTQECTRRAATYGMSVAGAAAIPLLVEVLAGASTDPDRAVTAAHALGSCVEAAEAQPVVEQLASVCTQAVAEIEAYEAGKTAEELAQAQKAAPRGEVYRAEIAVDFFVTDRRRVAAACLKSLGLIGAKALRAADAETALAAVDAIMPMACHADEVGGVFPTYTANLIVTNAQDVRDRPSVAELRGSVRLFVLGHRRSYVCAPTPSSRPPRSWGATSKGAA